MDTEAQSVFCASPSSPPDGHKPNREGNITRTSTAHDPNPMKKTNKKKKTFRPPNCARASLQQQGLKERAFGGTHLGPGWAVGLSLSPWLCCQCYHQREREMEREWSCGISAHCSGGVRERARIGAVRMMGVVGRGTGLFTIRWCSGLLWME